MMKRRIDAEMIEGLQEQIIKLKRVTKVVKGGRNFSFSAMMVVGNRNGIIGIGFGKAREIPEAIRKATEKAKRSLVKINLYKHTIPHEIVGKFCASKVWMMPASEGTGVIAGLNIRSVLEYAGVHNVLTKTYGSRNSINSAKAAFDCLCQLSDGKKMVASRELITSSELFD